MTANLIINEVHWYGAYMYLRRLQGEYQLQGKSWLLETSTAKQRQDWSKASNKTLYALINKSSWKNEW